MPEWVTDIIKIAIGVFLALLAHLIAFLRLKWKVKEDRKTVWAKKREPIYAQGLEFVYGVEKNQSNAEELDRILERWADWFPSNAIYLPPLVNKALHGAMHWTRAIAIDLHNRERDKKTWEIFRERLQTAKMMLMESKDIGWLPDNLK